MNDIQQKAYRFGLLFLDHMEKNFIAYVFLILSLFLFKANYSVGINLDHSLPGKLFLIHYAEKPKVGQLVVFHHKAPYIPDNITLTKIFTGESGDKLFTDSDKELNVGMHTVGYLKDKTKLGKPLTPNKETEVPAGKIFVSGSHKDSFDSRYAEFGFVDKDEIVGRAIVIF